jgi:RimJ/RimL family protein N-acetyltransferase
MKLEIQPGIYLREIDENDIVSIVKYANNVKISGFMRDAFPFPYTIDDAANWLGVVNENIPKRSFAIANDNEFIGAIGIEPCRDVNRYTGEIGYWIAEPFWGKGIATEAIKIFVKYIFNNYDLLKIFAHVFSSNQASTRVLEKAGFRLEGKLRNHIIKSGKVLDQLVYGILKEEILL